MSDKAAALLEQALALPADARAELAESLLESLDGPADAPVSDAWRHEIRRRAEAIDNNETATVLYCPSRHPDREL